MNWNAVLTFWLVTLGLLAFVIVGLMWAYWVVGGLNHAGETVYFKKRILVSTIIALIALSVMIGLVN